MMSHRLTSCGWAGWCLALLTLFALPAVAQDDTEVGLDAFGALPVLESGRLMPMDTYARLKLLQFSGKSTFERKPAVRWLADVFFRPDTITGGQVFLINHPEVAEALGIEPEKRRRYSFEQIEPAAARLAELANGALALDDEQRSLVDKELIRVQMNVDEWLQLAESFRFALPDAGFSAAGDEVRAAFGLPPQPAPLSFLDVFEKLPDVREAVGAMGEKAPDMWTPFERELFDVSSLVFSVAHVRRMPVPAMLSIAGHGGDMWVGPWDALTFFHQKEGLQEDLFYLRDMAVAYRDGVPDRFDIACRQLAASTTERSSEQKALGRLPLEVFFNNHKLFYRAELLYGVAFLLGLAALLGRGRWPRRTGLLLLALGLVPHTTGIVLRMLIMGRPPVTNLYATFVFVAWVGVLLGLLLDAVQRNGLGLTVGGVTGLACLMISARFASEGDPMGKVVAVLDSNFWLATHVVCITIGYAGCVVAGIIGHVYLLQAIGRPADREQRDAIFRALFGVLGFGLTFSFFGTMLGGVWADQSWGRFWGWDPKENGALLIVIWCAVLFHARLGRIIGDLGMAAGSVLGVIIVVFAWLGVNLLGVGLHSYGFTSGLARALFTYTAIELLFLAVATPLARTRTSILPNAEP